MYCSSCGNECNNNDKFCSKCGAKLKTNNQKETAIKSCPTRGERFETEICPFCSQNNETVNSPKNGCGIGCLIIFVLVMIFSIIASNETSTPSDNSFKEDIRGQESIAQFYCEETVKQNLKNPNGAKFPNILEYNFNNLGNMTYMVYSYVDATNSFGATIRTNFSCKVKVTGENTAIVEDINIE